MNLRKVLMPKVEIKIFILFLLLPFYNSALAQSTTCAAIPAVTCDPNATFTFTPSGGSGGGGAGTSYGCLGSQPNPQWYVWAADVSGSVSIDITTSPPTDVDYILYGPYLSPMGNCANLSAGNTIDCSFSGSTLPEQINGTLEAGKFYILLLTNFGGTTTDVTLAQVGGTGSLGGPLSLDLSTTGPFTVLDPPSIIATSPLVSDPNVINEVFSGTGVTGTMTGEFSPGVAGIGSHIVSVDALSFGCPVTSMTTIIVNCANPAISTTSSTSTACEGDADITISTSETTAGSGTIVSYNWTGDTGPLSSTSIANPTFSTATAGTYAITVTATTDDGCSASDDLNITINGLPAAPTTNNVVVCNGATTTTLTATCAACTMSGSIAWYPEDLGNPGNPDLTNTLATTTNYDPIASTEVDATQAGVYNFYSSCLCNGCVSAPALSTVTVNPDMQIDVTVKSCDAKITDEIFTGVDPSDDEVTVDITVTNIGGGFPVNGTLSLADLIGGGIVSGTTSLAVTAGDQVTVFSDVVLVGDGTTALNLQATFNDGTQSCLSPATPLGPFGDCSCLVIACHTDDMYQALESTGLNTAISTDYVLMDATGTTITQVSPTAIFDVTGLNPGIAYPYYTINYDPATGVVAPVVGGTLDPYNNPADPCHDVDVSFPCYIVTTEDFDIEGPADLCTNIGELNVINVVGGLDPDIYSIATTNSPNGTFPYSVFLFNQGETFENGDTPIQGALDGTAVPVVFSNINVSEPTSFSVAIEDGNGCISYEDFIVHPSYDPTLIADFILCLSSDGTNPTPDLDLTTLLPGVIPPVVDKPGRFTGIAGIINMPDLITPENSVHSIPGAVLDALLPAPGQTTITLTYTLGTEYPLPSGVAFCPLSDDITITLSRPDLPQGTGYPICEGNVIPAGEGFTSNCGVFTNWYDQDGITFLAQTATGIAYAPSAVENFTPGTYTYYFECVDGNNCISQRVPVQLVVTESPDAPGVIDLFVCKDETGPIEILPTSTLPAPNLFNIYQVGNNTSPINTTFQTGFDLQDATYTPTYFDVGVPGVYSFDVTESVEIVNDPPNSRYCESPAAQVNITVFPRPEINIGSNSPVCGGGDLILTSDDVTLNNGLPGYTLVNPTYEWVLDADNDGVVSAGDVSAGSNNMNTFTIPAITSADDGNTYYVLVSYEYQDADGVVRGVCSSDASNFTTISVTSQDLPMVVGGVICEGDNTPGLTATIPATNPASSILQWFANPIATTGEAILATGSPYTPPAPTGGFVAANSPYTYYVESHDPVSGCASDRVAVDLVVNETPQPPMVADQQICVGGTADNIIPTGQVGSTFTITGPASSVGPQATFSNGDLVVAGLNTGVADIYNFTITETLASAGNCTGVPGSFFIEVIDNTTPTPSNNGPVCAGDDITLTTASVPGATYEWRDGTNMLVSTDQSYTFSTTSTNNGETYTMTLMSASTCVSSVPVGTTISVITIPDATVVNEETICEGETLATPLEGNCTTGTVYWYDAATGGNLVNQGDQYSVPGTASLIANTYTYYISCVDPTNSCESDNRLPVNLTILANPAAPTVTDDGICIGGVVNTVIPIGSSGTSVFTLSGTGATVGPQATFSDADLTLEGLNSAVAGDYTFTIREVIGNCTGDPATLTITVNPAPPAVAGTSADPICIGDMKQLTADIAGVNANYDWYFAGADNIVGGTDDVFESNDQNPVVSPVVTSSYYVIVTSAEGCTSTSNLVSVIVNDPTDGMIVTDNLQICEGETLASAFEADCGTNTINWYDTATAGTLLSSGNSFIPTGTNVLGTGTYNYYAECVDADGCISMNRTTFTLVVNDTPDPPIVSNQEFCVGEEATTVVPIGSTPTSTFTLTGPAMSVGPQGTFVNTDLTMAGLDPSTAATYQFNVVEVTGTCIGAPAIFDITVHPTPPAVAGADSAPICVGQTKDLTADDGGIGATYNWYYAGTDNTIGGTDDIFESNDQNPTVAPIVTSNYYVVVTSAPGCVATSNMVTVIVNAPADAVTVTDNLEICAGETLATSFEADCGATTVNWYDAATAGTLLSTGATFIPVNSSSFGAGSYNYFAECEDAQGCVSVNRLPFTLTVNPSPSAPTVDNEEICEGETAPLIAPVGTTPTSEFTITYPDGTDVGTAAMTFTITNTNGFDNTLAGAYDFTVREVTGSSCIGLPTTFTITVSPIPPAVAGADATPICNGSTKPLTADSGGAGATYDWYYAGADNTIGGTDDVFESNDQNPDVGPSITSNYYVIVTSASGCVATSNMVTVIVNAPADAITVTDNLEICAGETLATSFEADCGATTVNWYDAATAGTLLSTGATFTPINTSALTAGTYNYFAECEDAQGCTSVNRLEFTLTVNPVPVAPTVIDQTICEGESPTTVSPVGSMAGSTFTLIGPASTVGPQATFPDTDLITAGLDINTVGDYTFEIREETGTCTGEVAILTITVSPTPPAVAGADATPICNGSTKPLTADSGGAGATYDWYYAGADNTIGGTDDVFESNDQNPDVGPSITSNYYVVVTSADGCVATSNMVTVIVNAPADAVTVTDNLEICEGETLTTSFEADCGATTVNWYDAASGGTLLSTGATFIPVNSSSFGAGSYNYFAECEDAQGCVSVNRLPFTLTVNPSPSAPAVDNEEICEGETAPLIAPVGTTPTSEFTITYPDGTDVGTAAMTFTITNTNGFDNTLAGAYDFTVREVTGSSCIGLPTTFTITVSPTPPAVAGADATPICNGSTKPLTADSGGAGATYDWYYAGADNTIGGTDDVFESNDQNPDVGPSITSNYYVIVTSASGCVATSNMVTVIVNAPADAITVTDNLEICAGETLATSFEADCGATTVNWYDAATAGTLLSTGATFTPINTSALTAGTYNYFAECEDAQGCTSVNRLEFTLTVNPVPVAPTVIDQTICEGESPTTVSPVGSMAGSTFTLIGPASTVGPQATFPDTDLITAGLDINTVGDYTFEIREETGTCTGEVAILTITVSPTPPAVAGADATPICNGSTKPLTADSGGAGATYDWYYAGADNTIGGTDDVFESNDQNPDVGPSITSNYYVVVTSADGCVATSNMVTVIVNAPADAVTVTDNLEICAGETLTTSFEADCGATTVNWYDAASGGTLLSTGATFIPVNSSSFGAGSYNYFAECEDAQGCVSVNRLPFTLTVNPSPSAPAVDNEEICEGETAPLIAPVGTTPTSEFTITYPDGTDVGTAAMTFTITNTNGFDNTLAGAYDFTVREVTGSSCIGLPTTFTITVSPIPPAVAGADATPICNGSTKPLTADSGGAGATYDWYYAGADNTIGGTDDVFESNDQNPDVGPSITSNYYVIVTSASGCTATSNMVTVIVNAPADAITVTDDLEICAGETLATSFEADCGATTVNWYDAATAGTLLSTGATFTPINTSALTAGTYNYFAECEDAQGCTSVNRLEFTLTVNPVPVAPTVIDQTICEGESPTTVSPVGSMAGSTFTLIGPASTVGPQATFPDTDLITAGLDINTVGDYTFEIREETGTCTGEVAILTITVSPTPPAVAGADATPICNGSTKPLTADSGGAGATYDWYYAGADNTIGGTDDVFESNDQNPDVGPNITSNYYVIVTSADGCVATSNMVTVIVNAPADAITVTDNLEICAGETLATSFEADCGATTVNWYDAASGGTLLSTGATFIPVNSSSFGAGSYNYFAECEDAQGCVSVNRLPFTLTVNPSPSAPAVDNEEICEGETAPLIAPVGTTPTSEFTITYPDGTDVGTAAMTFTITNTNGFDNTLAGAYDFTVREVTGSSCIGLPTTFTITVSPIPPAVAGADATPICNGSTKPLTADSGGAGATYDWYYAGADNTIGGTDDVFESNDQNPDVGPSITSNYYVIVTSASGCVATSNMVTVIVNAPADAITVTDNLEICAGETLATSFEADCGATTVNWYDAATAGTLLSTGATFTPINTSALTAGTYNYFAECEDAQGCTSVNRLEFTLTVNPVPVAPTVIDQTICEGESPTTVSPVGSMAGSTFTLIGPASTVGPQATFPDTDLITAGLDINTVGDYTFEIREETGTCTGEVAILTITVSPTPPAVAGADATPICNGSTKPLTADSGGAGATYDWYYAGADNTIGGTDDVFESNDQNPDVGPSITSNYYVVVTSADGCVATSNMVTVIVNAPADAVTVTDNLEICEGETLATSFEADCGATTVNWYDAASGGTLLSTGATFIPVNSSSFGAGSYNYFAECEDAQGCVSVNRLPFTLTVNPSPSAPAVDNEEICEGETAPLIAPVGTTPTSEFTITYPDGTDVGTAAMTFTITNTNGFDNTLAGAYDFTVREVTGSSCIGLPTTFTITVSPTPPAVAGPIGEIICRGEGLTLSADDGGVGATYDWYDAGADDMIGGGDDGLVSTDQNPTLSPESTAGFYVIVTSASGCVSTSNLVIVTVNSPAGPIIVTDNLEICEGETLLTAFESDCIGNTTNWYDNANNGNLLASGATFIPANTSNLPAGSYNYFAECEDAEGCTSVKRAIFTLIVNPNPAAPIVDDEELCIGGFIPLIAPVGETPTSVFIITYPDGTEVGAPAPTFAILSTNGFDNTIDGVYDFSVREVSTSNCIGEPATFTITVNPFPPAVAGVDATPICIGESIMLTADDSGVGATYNWYYAGADGMIGGFDDVLVSNDQNPIVSPTMTSNYYVTVSSGPGCNATSNVVTVTVNEPVNALTVIDNLEICEGETLATSFEADCGAITVNWYDAASGGILLSNGTTFIPINTSALAAGTYNYFAECEDAQGCVSIDRLEFTLTVNSSPDAPMVTDEAICFGNTPPVITPIGEMGLSIFNIYGTSSALALQTNQNTFDLADVEFAADFDNMTPGTYTFEVREITTNGCEGPSSTITITVEEEVVPTIVTIPPTCEGDPVTLNTTMVPGATYSWYLNGDPTDIVANTYEHTFIATADDDGNTYNVTVTLGGCVGTSVAETLVVNSIDAPDATMVVDDSVCEGGATPVAGGLQAPCGTGGTTNWYDALLGGNLLSTDAVFIPADIESLPAGSYTYYAECEDANGCHSLTRTPVTLTVSPVPAPPMIFTPTEICSQLDRPVVTPVGSVAGATFNIYSANTLIESGLPEFDLNQAIYDAYIPANVAGTYTFIITEIGQGPLACEGTPGTYTLTVTDTPPQPAPNNDGPVCVGNDVQLTTGTVANATYAWYDDVPDPNDLTLNLISTQQNPVLFNATATDEGTYYVIVTIAGCTSDPGSTFVDIIELVGPANPVDQSICEGQSLAAPLEVDTCSAGGSVTWWDAPSGGNQVGSGETYFPNNTSSLSEGTYPYYAQCEDINGCISSRTQVDLIVTPKPATPTISTNAPICEGEDLILTTSVVPGATYQWVGPLGASTTTLMNPLLTTTTNSTTITDADTPYLAGEWSVQIIVNGCLSELSAPVIVTINPIPVATATNNGPICPGEDVQLFAGNVPGATYQWTESDSTTIISTEQNPIIFNLQSTQTYELTINLDGCLSPIASTTVTVNPLPMASPVAGYTLNPDCSPADLTLTANAIGNAPLSFEWTGPNGFMSNAENPVIPNATSANNGSYTLTVTDVNGCEVTEVTNVVSDIANQVAQPVVSSTGPACEGETIILTVPVYFGSSVNYTWNIPSNVNVTGENTNEIVISPVDSGLHEGDYTVTVEVDGCILTSDIYSLDVYVLPTAAPTATTADICEGGTLELFANATNGVTYQWTGPNGFMSNAENPVISNVTVANNGGYTIVVTSVSGCSISESITVGNILPTPITPSITTNSPVCIDGNLSLSVQQVYSGTIVSYSWINGAGTVIGTGSSITIAANDVDAVSPYSVQVTVDGCASDVSAPAEVIVNPLPVATATNNGPICPGEDVQLFAGSVPGASYQWTIAGSATIISTEQNPIIFNLLADETYELTIISEGCVSNPLAQTTVTVNTPPTAMPVASYTLNPDCSPSDLTISANANGSAPLSYTWTGPNGFMSNAENPVIPNATSANNGSYTLTVTDVNGCEVTEVTNVVSDIANQVAQPTITSTGPACEGATIILTIPQYTGSSVNYTWNIPSNVNVTGENTNEIVISPVDSTLHEGDYTVTVEVDGCTLTSDVYTLDVYQEPTAAPTATATDICEGGTLELFANALDGDTYLWTGPNGFTSNAENPVISNVTVANNGGYTLVVTSVSGCETSESITVNNILPTPTTPSITTNSPVCIDGTITLNIQQVYTGTTVAYEWINGAGTIIGTGSSQTIVANDPDAISPYSVQVTVDGCPSDVSIPADVIVNPLPSAAASNNGPICAGDAVQLFAGNVTGASYEWREVGNPTIVSTTQNPTIFNVSVTTSYELTVIANGCVSNPLATTTVVVNPLPVITNISGTGTYCEGETVTLSADNSVTAGMINVTYTWTGSNGFSFTGTTTAAGPFDVVLNNVNSSDEGTYDLVLESNDGCISTVASVNIEVDSAPMTPTITNNGPLCAGDILQLSTTPYTGTPVEYEWFFNGTSVAMTTIPNYAISGVTPADAGFYTMIVTVDGCPSLPSNTTLVTIGDPQMPMPTAIDTTICEGESISLSSGQLADGYLWTGPSGFSSTLANPIITNTSTFNAGTYYLVITEDGCDSPVGSITIVVNALPAAATVDNSSPSCVGSNVILEVTSGFGGPTAVYQWFEEGTNTPLGPASSASDFTLQNITQADAGGYYVVITEDGCSSLPSLATQVIINSNPGDAADAGPDITVCGVSTTNLNASIPIGSGVWTTNSPGVSIVDPADPQSLVTGLSEGSHVFTWTISNGTCINYDFDEVTVIVTNAALDLAFAGVNQGLCEESQTILQGDTTFTDPDVIGTWTQTTIQENTGVVIVDLNDPNTLVEGLFVEPGEASTTFIFTWTLSNGVCGDFDSDEVLVTVYRTPNDVAYAGEDMALCGDMYVLEADALTFGTGLWTSPTIGVDIASPDELTTIVDNLVIGENIFIWTLSNGACADYSNDTIIVVREEPVSSAMLNLMDDMIDVTFNEVEDTLLIFDNDLIDASLTNVSVEIVQGGEHGKVRPNVGGIISYDPDNNYLGTDSFLYSICAANSCGTYCDTALVIINVGVEEGSDCFVPNIITPGIDGHNDEFIIPCLVNYPDNKLMVFNRWGDKVYEAAPYNNDWKGTYNNEDLPQGTYYYILILDQETNERQTGFLTIHR